MSSPESNYNSPPPQKSPVKLKLVGPTPDNLVEPTTPDKLDAKNVGPTPDNFDDIADIIKVGTGESQTAHRPDGKFLSKHHIAEIREKADIIRGINEEGDNTVDTNDGNKQVGEAFKGRYTEVKADGTGNTDGEAYVETLTEFWGTPTAPTTGPGTPGAAPTPPPAPVTLYPPAPATGPTTPPAPTTGPGTPPGPPPAPTTPPSPTTGPTTPPAPTTGPTTPPGPPPAPTTPPSPTTGPTTPPGPPPAPTTPPSPTTGPTTPPAPTTGPGTPGTPPGPPSGPGTPDVLGPQIEAELDIRLADFAAARIALEKVGGGGEAEQHQFDNAERELQEVYAQWEDNEADRMAIEEAEIDQKIFESLSRQTVLVDDINDLENDLSAATTAGNASEVARINAELASKRSEFTAETLIYDALRDEKLTLPSRMNATAVDKVSEIRQSVDEEMIAQREKARPRLTKFINFVKKHPKTRFALGVAFSAMAIGGFATGIIPLGIAGTIGRSALGGIGAYNASKTAGSWLYSRRARNNPDMDPSQQTTIAGYTNAAESQSDYERRNKKVATGIGAFVASVPLVRGLMNLDLQGPQGLKGDPGIQGPKGDPGEIITGPPSPPTVDDNSWPWTHFETTKGLGQQGATDKIYELVNKGPRFGYTVDHVNSGTSYSIPSITDPSGNVITGNVAINRTLDIIDNL